MSVSSRIKQGFVAVLVAAGLPFLLNTNSALVTIASRKRITRQAGTMNLPLVADASCTRRATFDITIVIHTMSSAWLFGRSLV